MEEKKSYKAWTISDKFWEVIKTKMGKADKETRNLEKKELHRSYRKIDPEKLKAYVAEHPDLY